MIIKGATSWVEDLGLKWQKGTAGIDDVNARQTVFQSDFLSTQLFLECDRKYGSAFDRGIIGDDLN